MGFLGFGKKRERETAEPPAAPPPSRDAEPVGQIVEGAGPGGFDLSALGGGNVAELGSVFSMIGQAMQSGQAQIHVNPGQQHVVNVGNPDELGERMKAIMRKHGIDPDTGTQDGEVDMVALQSEMMQALTGGGAMPGGEEGSQPQK